ncbi:hypothetical protein HOO65_010150 [Ceratocystis lukuohia]|uniref:Uncharacterized protein n=1 Tax=Ceratocystis lukuohia TaxID=2019550 RepID=A0ABR4MR95_9PEZI
MEDQFGGRTDDDLFYDDFEPVDGQVIVMPDIPLELAAAFGKKSQGLLATPKPELVSPEDSNPASKDMPSQKGKMSRLDPDASVTPPISSPAPLRGGLANSRFAPKADELEETTSKPNAPADAPKQKKNNRLKAPKAAKSRDVASAPEIPKSMPPKSETPAKKPTVSETPPSSKSKSVESKHTSTKSGDATAKPHQPQDGNRPNQTGKNLQSDQSTVRKDKGQSFVSRKPMDNTRIQSGANPRTKMTEEEVTAKMDQMRLKNAETVKKFEAAEKDETRHAVAVANDEAEIQRRRKIEAEERKKLENERQKNRDKKLKSFKDNDTPWDAPKPPREPRGPREPREPNTAARSGRGSSKVSGNQGGGGLQGSMHGSAHKRNDDPLPKANKENIDKHNKPADDLFPSLSGASSVLAPKTLSGPSFAKAARAGAEAQAAATLSSKVENKKGNDRGSAKGISIKGDSVIISLPPTSSDKPVVAESEAWKPKALTPLPVLDVGNWGDEMEEYEAQQAQKAGDK